MTLDVHSFQPISSTRLGGSTPPLSVRASTPLALSRLLSLPGRSSDERGVRDERRRTTCRHPSLFVLFSSSFSSCFKFEVWSLQRDMCLSALCLLLMPARRHPTHNTFHPLLPVLIPSPREMCTASVVASYETEILTTSQMQWGEKTAGLE